MVEIDHEERRIDGSRRKNDRGQILSCKRRRGRFPQRLLRVGSAMVALFEYPGGGGGAGRGTTCALRLSVTYFDTHHNPAML